MDPVHPDQRRLLLELSDRADERQRADERHSRQIRFAPFGAEAQARLARSHALVIGVGALGTHVAQTLARAGIGRLTLIDRDVVDLSNLQRQVLFDTLDARQGLPKASAAAGAISRIDPEVEVVALDTEFDASLWSRLDRLPDVLIDGTDNFATRFAINAISIESGIPWVHGAAVGSEGRAMVIRPGTDPCLGCILPDAPNDGGGCDAMGVLAPAVAHVAAFQATEALKLLGGRSAAVTRGLFVLDVWRGRFDLLFQDASPRPDCAACGAAAPRAALSPATGQETPGPATSARAASLCGRNAIQIRPSGRRVFDLAVFATPARAAGYAVEDLGGRALRVTIGQFRVTLFPDGRALVFGTEDPERALATYDAILAIGTA